jgi:hypothetical protein
MEAQHDRNLYHRLNDHFQACLDLTRSERDRYVAALAKSDPDLEKKLRELLRFHDGDEGTALRSPVASVETPRESTRTRRRKSRFSAPGVILIVGAVSIAVVLGIQTWALARLEADLKLQMASNLKAAVDLRVSNIRAFAAAQKQQAQKVLQDPVLVEQVTALIDAAKSLDSREARKERLLAHPSTAIVAERMQRAPPGISDRGFAVLSSSGVCVATYHEPALGITLGSAGADYLGRVNLGETVISRPYPDWQFSQVIAPEPKNPVMFVAGPIRDPSGQVIGLGSFRFNPSHLYEILGAARAEFVAFDAKGLVLNNLSDGADLRSWGVSTEPRTALHAYLRDPGIDLTSGRPPDSAPDSRPQTEMSRSATQGRDGMDASGQRDLRGRMVVAAWAWLPEWEMGIGGTMPVSTVLAPMAPVRTAFNVLLGVFAALTFGLFFSTRYVRVRMRTAQDSPFGAYTVEHSLGKGGMAEVFYAQHAYLRRPAALKILSHANPDAASVDRFEREARLASRLAHPNTIQVFDFGETPDGRLYYAMEYIEGLTLAQLLTVGGLPPVGRAVHLLRQVAGSLGEAHQIGLLHRDLKPSNIMITARGGLADLVKVLDFGIACSVQPGTDDHTRSTDVIGTPSFLAPERIQSPAILDPRSDLYAFGAVAFYLLTGRHVFEGASPTELLYQVLTAPRPSPSQLRGKRIPDALEKLVLDCLSIDPQNRPAGIREIEELLESVAAVERWTPADALEWWAVNQELVSSFRRATR